MPLKQIKKNPTKGTPYRVWLYSWERLGGHVHIDVFVANSRATTYQKTGKLVMDPDDFAALRAEHKGSQKVDFKEVVSE